MCIKEDDYGAKHQGRKFKGDKSLWETWISFVIGLTVLVDYDTSTRRKHCLLVTSQRSRNVTIDKLSSGKSCF